MSEPATTRAEAPAPFLKAAGLMLLSTTFFGLMAIVIRLASDAGIATVEIAFFRNLFGLLALLPFLAQGGSSVVMNWAVIALLLRISDQTRRPAPSVTPLDSDDETQVVKLT